MQPALPNQDYSVAWICALPLEKSVAVAVLDAIHDEPREIHPKDHNSYQLGSIGKHNIVITCLPSYGTINAAVAATRIAFSFPSIKVGLMVGIGGGIPNASYDVRLGDIVVSKPDNNHGGVVQYDLGKTVQGGLFKRTGLLNKPPNLLLNAMASLQAN